MNYKKDITGQKFNLLTVLKYSHTEKGHGSYWLCVCECGNKKTIRIDGLKAGQPRSCGCLQKKWVSSGRANRTHGKSTTKIYKCWLRMKSRCFDKKNQDYKHYGNRGITVCKRWFDFETFAKDMGAIPSNKHTIERIDNDGNYEPRNCKWLENTEQNKNKRNSIILSYKGKTQCLKEWSKYFGVNYSTLHKKIRYSGKDYMTIFQKLSE